MIYKAAREPYNTIPMADDFFIVQGLGGKRSLSGELPVRGSKNAALPAMASSLLFDGPLTLSNIPLIGDVEVMGEMLEELGAEVKRNSNGDLVIDAQPVRATSLPRELAKQMRASVILAGPLLARFGEIAFPHPGGCVIGARPIDLFLEGFQKMGAEYEEADSVYRLRAPKTGLRGADIFFRQPTVTGTETLLLAATRAHGKTLLRNAAMEPEVVFLAELLRASGAHIKGEGTPTIEIIGTEKLLRLPAQAGAPRKSIAVIPDRIETGSFLILGALAGKDISITHCEPEHIRILIELLRTAGVNVEAGKDSLLVRAPIKKGTAYKSFGIKTHEYPGFPTDLQAPATVFLTQAHGEALVHETIFDGRLAYTKDLVAMGADIALWDAHRASVKGPTPLRGRELHGPDLRAGLAYLIAAIVARGKSVIYNAQLIDRGYERIEERLKKIGVMIERVSN
ncbi:MAG: UDP-N-acetylglucosamine 1-carboxyvinyltransferase MurA [Parcubacteria group bacterium Gr01-1014_17]|nr:MAG: UDP-N-acetylglucosamine 1-carboxyvinyltransferase MurA [Parcubacteria group bacterium Gr01-1014_17]